MIAGFRAVWRGVRHLNHQGYVYVWANLLWLALSLPILTAPAAWLGLNRLAYNAVRNPTAEFNDLWQGFKDYWRRGIVLALINIVFIAVTITNLIGFRDAPGLGFAALRFVWIAVLIIWLTIQAYALALFHGLEQPTLVAAFRNGAVMFILNPLFSLVVMLCVAVIAIISTLLPAAWLLLTGSALAAILNVAVYDRLIAAGVQPPPPPTDEPADAFPLE